MATAAELHQKYKDELKAYEAWLPAQRTEDGGFKDANTFLPEMTNREAALKAASELAINAANAEESERKANTSQGRLVTPTAETESKGITDPDGLDRAFKSAFNQHADQFKAVASGDLSKGFPRFELPVEAKTLVSLTHHYPAATRAQTTGMAMYYNSVEDLFATGATGSNGIEYFIQSLDTDNAGPIAEGSAVTDNAMEWTKVTDEVEIVQAWIPVTREFLNDNEGMQSVIMGRLVDQLDKNVSEQLMYGTGSTPSLWGVTVRTNFASQAKGADPAFDTILKAIDKVVVAGDATPDAVVMHPTDYMEEFALLRTADGIYILGNPGNTPNSPTLWGLPVRLTTTVAAAAGTACVGAFRSMAQIFNNGGVVVETSTEHSTYFTERKVVLAVSRRLAVANYRPTAFVKVTGL